MMKWHLDAFDICPIGQGYEVEVNEFDYKDDNGICYDKDGVTARAHWDGLFQFGADVAVVNVTKDAIWYRKAVLPDKSGAVPPMRELMQMAARAGKTLPKEFVFPNPRTTREAIQEQYVRDMEIAPEDYTPGDVQREQLTSWPNNFTIRIYDRHASSRASRITRVAIWLRVTGLWHIVFASRR